eukprot:2953949-Alexandrium_andersonii.AAC.1
MVGLQQGNIGQDRHDSARNTRELTRRHAHKVNLCSATGVYICVHGTNRPSSRVAGDEIMITQDGMQPNSVVIG